MTSDMVSVERREGGALHQALRLLIATSSPGSGRNVSKSEVPANSRCAKAGGDLGAVRLDPQLSLQSGAGTIKFIHRFCVEDRKGARRNCRVALWAKRQLGRDRDKSSIERHGWRPGQLSVVGCWITAQKDRPRFPASTWPKEIPSECSHGSPPRRRDSLCCARRDRTQAWKTRRDVAKRRLRALRIQYPAQADGLDRWNSRSAGRDRRSPANFCATCPKQKEPAVNKTEGLIYKRSQPQSSGGHHG